MKFRLFIFLYIFLSVFSANSQIMSNVDSLKEITSSMPNDSVKVANLYKIAVSLYRENPQEMLIYANKSIQLAEKLNLKTEIAKSYHVLGIYYANKVDLQRALDYFFKSLKILENIKDENRKAVAFGAIARVYQMMDNNEDALKYDLQALKLALKNNDTINLATNYNNVGADYYNLQNYENALVNYRKALLLAEKYKKQLKGVLFINIGYSYLNTKNVDSAYIYYKKSEKFYKKTSDSYGLTTVYNKLAEYYNECKKNDSLYYYAIKSYRFGNNLSMVSEIKNSSKLLENYFSSKKMYDSAYFYQKIYFAMNDSINNSSNTKRITQLEMQYNFDKEKNVNKIKFEAKVARERNVKLFFVIAFSLSIFLIIAIFRSYRNKKKSEEKLQQLNATKDKFFRIISHDLKGPFSAFISISEILSNPKIELSKERVQYFANSINKSAKSTYDLFQNLLLWSMSQRENLKISKNDINLRKISDSVIDLLKINADSKNIEIQNLIPKDFIIFSDENIIKTIFRNLLNNAIKFTKESGKITFSVKEDNSGFQIFVEDTGVGISEENLQKIFKINNQISTTGTNNEKGTGLGLILCKELIMKVSGNISVKSKIGKGSKFIISIPRKL